MGTGRDLCSEAEAFVERLNFAVRTEKTTIFPDARGNRAFSSSGAVMISHPPTDVGEANDRAGHQENSQLEPRPCQPGLP
jgi:hypothetical protein